MKSSNLVKELKKLDGKAIAAKVVEMRQALLDTKYNFATGEEKNSAKVRVLRRDLARALTLQSEEKRANNVTKPLDKIEVKEKK
jgi:ribosomal protein L29